MLSQRHGPEERDMNGGHTDTCKCFTANPQSLQRLGLCCGRRQFARPHYAHHLEEMWKGNCARLNFKRYRQLAKVCVQNSWGSPSSTSLMSLLWDRELNSFNGGGHDWKRHVNQVAELLGVIPLLPVRLQTRCGVVACSTTFEGRRRLCPAQSDVSKSFPRCFRRERRKQNGRQYKFLIFNTSVDT